MDSSPYFTDPTGQEHPLSRLPATIGRALENDIVIASKRSSREHARIRREGRRLYVEDLGSTNGTYLNGERLTQPAPLRDGDQLSIGEISLTFHDPDSTMRESPFPELEVNLAAGLVRVNRAVVTLSPKEFALLALLYQQRGRVCSKEEIGQAVWSEYRADVYDYQIENLVRRLRTRIEVDPTNPQLLLTVRGLGYKLVSG